MKALAVRQAHRLGLQIGRSLRNDDVARIAARLWPVVTEKPLIRLGGDADGGYLVPDDLEGIAACFSPGVAATATFEEAMINRSIRCFLADASVDSPPIDSPMIVFDRKFLGVVNDADTTTLDSWVERKMPAGGEFVLQMDIEGAEWAVLLGASWEVLRSFRIVVVELHWLERLVDPVTARLFDACLARLGEHFHVVHAHVNNCEPLLDFGGVKLPKYLEVTYLRKDRAKVQSYATQFPHPLDHGNLPNIPDVILPKVFRH